MSNERIDLTRFEGHTKGEWSIDEGNLMVRTDEISVRLAEPYWDDGITADEDTINKKLMISAPDLLAELKRCYELIDDMQGNVPYVEHCEECGASDGFQTEGCGDCGIIHYQTSRGLRGLHGYTWGFFHKDSPLWEKYR